ncbi:MAG: STAS/SEC14 domain-containing protein, partial [Bdellovibrionales bacterium]|nr:STAS/SEC14 domain-containing protein [Bdellovibrionales bacterium]
MLQEIKMPSNDLVGFEAIGTVTADDYQKQLHPFFEKARAEGRKLRFLYYFGPQFEGFTPGAGLEDMKLGFRHIRNFERIAVVADQNWIRSAAHFVGSMLPCPVQAFKASELSAAKEWLNTGDIGLDFEMNKELGVLKVELTAPLSSTNFDVLAQHVDEWVEKEGELKGLVVHAKKFPGWEDFGSFLSHMT